ncbi:MAG TPA: hypothetical protein VGP80_10440, partial [Gemmatimonadales bacterium]|nr:hypothetical protein [Gemmatimonadales bacterium]
MIRGDRGVHPVKICHLGTRFSFDFTASAALHRVHREELFSVNSTDWKTRNNLSGQPAGFEPKSINSILGRMNQLKRLPVQPRNRHGAGPGFRQRQAIHEDADGKSVLTERVRGELPGQGICQRMGR